MPKVTVESLMADHGLTREQATLALAEAKAATKAKRHRLITADSQPIADAQPSLTPATSWVASEAGTLDRWVNAILDAGSDIDRAIAATGCPRDVAMELMTDARFPARLSEIMSLRVKLRVAAKAADYADSAYGGKVLTEIFKAQTADEAEAQQARALKTGGTKERLKALRAIITEAARQYEILTGGHSPLPDELASIVRSVTVPENAGSEA